MFYKVFPKAFMEGLQRAKCKISQHMEQKTESTHHNIDGTNLISDTTDFG